MHYNCAMHDLERTSIVHYSGFLCEYDVDFAACIRDKKPFFDLPEEDLRRDLENFDLYVKQIERLGLEEIAKVKQAQWDRY